QGHSLNADLEIDECGMICSGLGRSIAQLVIAGIGVQPVIDMLTNRGLGVGESSQTDVLTAGDVANYQDMLFGRRRRVEHWDKPFRKVNIALRYSWANAFRSGTCLISFLTSSIRRMNIGAIRQAQ